MQLYCFKLGCVHFSPQKPGFAHAANKIIILFHSSTNFEVPGVHRFISGFLLKTHATILFSEIIVMELRIVGPFV